MRRAWRFASLSLAYAIGFVIFYVVAVRTAEGQRIDAGSLGVLGWLRGEAWLAFYEGRSVVLYGLLAVAAVAALTAALERRWTPVLLSIILVAVVAVASVGMKAVLPRPDLGDFAYAHNTFPSSHAAIALAASVAVIWCRPPWMSRVLVFVLAALVAYVSLGSVLSFAHRASDTFGGIVLTGAVSCALAAFVRTDVAPVSRLRRGVAIGSALAIVVASLYLLEAIGLFGGGDHMTQLGVAIVLGVLGLLGSVLAVHRPLGVQPQVKAIGSSADAPNEAL
ncbi:membrane-associated phospholipid phosphatase [Microbacterium terrae]|uniref:phosphatase PAP2 family protein n=1 Tax=Microbacterium terrae TaxID=69369 RepID=UPI0005ECEC25|nr:phosphatase PAP2 family protein [Microbacterium terrae]MBP1078586.1 membrane-associated phospholipid phosphatase [Microbacterium terrae]